MGKQIHPGRYTIQQGEDIVVFIIGMRINKWHAVRKWVPVARAMGPMIRELYQNKELGFIHVDASFTGKGITMIQYWKSFDDLKSYAKAPKHLTAWRSFNKTVRKNDAVGIYHETYVVPHKQYEAIYANMPEQGLAKALGRQSINPPMETADQRINA